MPLCSGCLPRGRWGQLRRLVRPLEMGPGVAGPRAAGWAGAGVGGPRLPACVPCRPDGASRGARRGVKAAFLHRRSPELRDTGCTARVRPAVGALGPGAAALPPGGRGRDFTTVGGGPPDPAANGKEATSWRPGPERWEKGSPLRLRGEARAAATAPVCPSSAKDLLRPAPPRLAGFLEPSSRDAASPSPSSPCLKHPVPRRALPGARVPGVAGAGLDG